MRSILDDVGQDASRDGKLVMSATDVSDKIAYAFQLATLYGPLCQEPAQGVAIILEQVTIEQRSSDESSSTEASARLSSEVIRVARDAMRQGFLDWSPRIYLAMYSCEIQTSSEFKQWIHQSYQC